MTSKSEWLNFLIHERDFAYKKRKRYSFSRFLIILTPFVVVLMSIIVASGIAQGYDPQSIGVGVIIIGAAYIFGFALFYRGRIAVSEANAELSLGIHKIINDIMIGKLKRSKEIEKEYLQLKKDIAKKYQKYDIEKYI